MKDPVITVTRDEEHFTTRYTIDIDDEWFISREHPQVDLVAWLVLMIGWPSTIGVRFP